MRTEVQAEGRNGSSCLSELRLDQLLAGELEPAALAASERHLAGCTHCTARRAAREEERRLFRASFPPLRLPATQPAPPLAASRRRRWLWLGSGGLAAAAAATLLFVQVRGGDGEETVTGKGVQLLRYYVRDAAAGSVRQGRPLEVVHPRDQLRFGFDGAAVAGRRVALLGRDAAGKVTAYFPDASPAAAPLPPTADGLLPYSIALDQTLGRETIYALYCRDPVALAPLLAALARSEAAVAWPPGCQVERLQLDKKPRR
jgi:hypothetical protein